MATISDVARRAGVSATTVSHAISGNRPVSAATAAAVKRSVEELGYVPNRAARNLRLGAADTIGILIPDITNPYFASLARGVEDTAAAADVGVLLCNTDFSSERELRYFRTLRAGGAGGVIYAAGRPPEPRRLRAVARSMPFVAVDESLAGVLAAEVVSDNHGGGREAGEHLLALGHRQALVIEGPRQLPSAGERRRGFLAGFRGADVDARVRPGDYLATAGETAVRAELDAAAEPWFTAIFAANDMMAIGAIAELRRLGLRVPEDVSVIGFDDSPPAALSTPALTTVRQDAVRLGSLACGRLLDALAEPDAPSPGRLTVPTKLIRRQSTEEVRR
jgi:LacI family transcriptional regulator